MCNIMIVLPLGSLWTDHSVSLHPVSLYWLHWQHWTQSSCNEYMRMVKIIIKILCLFLLPVVPYFIKALSVCQTWQIREFIQLLLFPASVTATNLIYFSVIHTENPIRCSNVSKFYYSIFKWSSTCFGLYTAHHQEPKTVLAASGFAYMEDCRMCSCWTLSGSI
jgi:hypothetical protein